MHHQPAIDGRTHQWRDRLADERAYAQRARRQPSLVIRTVTSDDSGLLVDLLARLSEQTCWLRYMTPRPMGPDIAQLEAARMTQGQTHDHVTLLALIPSATDWEVIAVAELIRDRRSPRAAEIAVVVRDDNQGQGIGRALVEQLVQRAASSGIDSIRAELLAENRRMLRLLRGLGLPQSTTTHQGETQVVLHLPEHARDHAIRADAPPTTG